jgi:HEAT repeat protein
VRLSKLSLLGSLAGLLCALAVSDARAEDQVTAQSVAIRVEALASTNAEQEAAARASLVEMGPDALPHLLKPLADRKTDYAVRASVAWVLGELGDARANEPLKAAWAESGAPGYFKMQVAMAMASLGDLEPLRSFVTPTAKDKILVAKAAIGLANMGDTQSIDALRAFAQDDTVGAFVRLALARLGHDPGRDELRKLLTTQIFRDQAALGLARLGDNNVIFQLRFCLASEDPFVRRDAAELLGKREDLESGPKLETMAKEDRDPRVRAACAAAAKKIDRKRRRTR